MKRLSQTWQQKRSVKSTNTIVLKERNQLEGKKDNCQNSDLKFKITKSTCSLQKDHGVSEEFDSPSMLSDLKTTSPIARSKAEDGLALTPFGDGLFNLSPSFNLDASALVEVERIEKNCFPSPETKPEKAISSVADEKNTVGCLVQDKEETPRISAPPSSTVYSFVLQSPFTRRERISTPIEDTHHILVSPSDRSPAFSPVPLVFSHTPTNGSTSSRNSATNISILEDPFETSRRATPIEYDPKGTEILALSSWGLPPSVLQNYKDLGITNMFQWQAECLRTGNVLKGGNLVYTAPTSAGKTMVAELLVLKRVLETKRKALFILPFVSVAREKMFYLQRMFHEAGVKVEGFMGSHSPSGGFATVDVAVCTIEKANSVVNKLMEEKKISILGVVVVDELHLIGDPGRGYLLELLLTKIRYISSDPCIQINNHHGNPNNQEIKGDKDNAIQIVGMSATLPNLNMLADWLNADLYCTDYRPVPLTEMIKVSSTVYDGNMKKLRDLPQSEMVAGDEDHVILLTKETISCGHSVLIFCPTKNWCEKLAENIAKHFAAIGNLGLTSTNKENQSGFVKASSLIAFDYNAIHEVLEQLRRTPVGVDSSLSRTVPHGVAFHHAGLTIDERDVIEGGFRQGAIKVLVATSTLSSGVNLPARRVIIRTPMFHGKLVDPLVYKQMAGRAGRKGVDTRGESILICKPVERQRSADLLTCQLKPVKSCLFDYNEGRSIKRALLEVIVSGVATRQSEVERYSRCTFYSSCQGDEDSSQENITSTIRFLVENEFIRLQPFERECMKQLKSEGNENATTSEERYVPTQLGTATLASALSPDEALTVFAELQKARKCFVLENELHILYQVTPIYIQSQWPTIDWYQYLRIWEHMPTHMRRVSNLVGVEEAFLARAVRGRIPTRTEEQRASLAIHRRFFAALALHDLVHEMPLPVVAQRYGATKGMLQSLQASAATFAGMVTIFCQKLGWSNLELLLSQFQSRLTFGVERELCDLVRISVLNAARARMLYSAGYHSIAALSAAVPGEVEQILRNAAPFVSGLKRTGETDYEVRERNKARVIWVPGLRGLTETDAAKRIVLEAKHLVQKDVAQLGIKWNPSCDTGEEAGNTSEKEDSNRIGRRRSSENNADGSSSESNPSSNSSIGRRKRTNGNKTRYSAVQKKNPRLATHSPSVNDKTKTSKDQRTSSSGCTTKFEKEYLETGKIRCNQKNEKVDEDQSENGAVGFVVSEKKARFSQIDLSASGVTDSNGVGLEQVSVKECESDVQRNIQDCNVESCKIEAASRQEIKDVTHASSRLTINKPIWNQDEDRFSSHGMSASSSILFDLTSNLSGSSKVLMTESRQSTSVELYSETLENEDSQTTPSKDKGKSKYDSQEIACSLSDTFLNAQYNLVTCGPAKFPDVKNIPMSDSEDNKEELNVKDQIQPCLLTSETTEVPLQFSRSFFSARISSPKEVKVCSIRELGVANTEIDTVESFSLCLSFSEGCNEDSQISLKTLAMIDLMEQKDEIQTLPDNREKVFGENQLQSQRKSTSVPDTETKVSLEEESTLTTIESKPTKRLENQFHGYSSLSKRNVSSSTRNACKRKTTELIGTTNQKEHENAVSITMDSKSKIKQDGESENDSNLPDLIPSTPPRMRQSFSSCFTPGRITRSCNRIKNLIDSPLSSGYKQSPLHPHQDMIPTSTRRSTRAREKRPVNSTSNTSETFSSSSSSVSRSSRFPRGSIAQKPDLNPLSKHPRDQHPHLSDETVSPKSKIPRSIEPLLTPSCALDDTLSIIDVAGHDELFETFMTEWKEQSQFAIAVACERSLGPQSRIGARFNSNGGIKENPRKGLKIGEEGEVIVGLAVSWGKRDAYYVSLLESEQVPDVKLSAGILDEPALAPRLSLNKRIEAIRLMLESQKEQFVKTCFTTKEIAKVLYRSCGISLAGNLRDPKIAYWILDPGAKERNLQQLVAHYLSGDYLELLEGIGADFGGGSMGLNSASPVPGQMRACTEVVVVFALMEKIWSVMTAESLQTPFEKVEMPSQLCLARMELNGFGFSEVECEKLKSILQAKLRTLEEEAYSLANHSFSLTCPQDVAQVLFIKLKLPPDGNPETAPYQTTRNTKNRSVGRGVRSRHVKRLSTNKDVLEKLRNLHPLPGVILEWRRVNAALSKVVFPLQREKSFCPELNMARIHSFSQTHTATGRVSFSEPNLQNVPKDFEIELPTVISESPPLGTGLELTIGRGRRKGRRSGLTSITPRAPLTATANPGQSFSVSMRNAFVPFEQGVLLAADYSQLELRLIAHLAEDERLQNVLNSGGDVFKMIACEIACVPIDSVTDQQRQRAKQICYGIIYGIGAKALGEQLDISEDDAAVFMETFKSKYREVKKYLKSTLEFCKKHGYVKTLMGRKRYLPSIHSTNSYARSQAERQAVNTTVQGSAADLVKIAMINIEKRLGKVFPSCALPHRNNRNITETPFKRRQSRLKGNENTPRGGYFVLQLHDELIYEVAKTDLKQVAEIVRQEMETAVKLSVLFPVKLKVGSSWGNLSPFEL